MEYQPPQIRMGIERPFQHPGDLGHVRVERKFARDDFAREHVFDRAEVAFAPREVELADVGRSFLVRPRAGEIAFVVDGAVLPNAFDQKELWGLPRPGVAEIIRYLSIAKLKCDFKSILIKLNTLNQSRENSLGILRII